MTYSTSTDRSRMQVETIHRWLASTYWSPRVRLDLVRQAIANSLVIGVFDDASGRQVAFARVVTDRTTFAWLCDVYVDERHRGRGLSKRMVGELIALPEMQTLRRWCLATKDAHGLYRQFGFTPIPAERWMELRLPESNWQGPIGDDRAV